MNNNVDMVNNPSHYTYGSIETIDFIDSCGYGLDFCLGNAIKYISRCKHKGTMIQDLLKSVWYLNHAISKLKKEEHKLKRKRRKNNGH